MSGIAGLPGVPVQALRNAQRRLREESAEEASSSTGSAAALMMARSRSLSLGAPARRPRRRAPRATGVDARALLASSGARVFGDAAEQAAIAASLAPGDPASAAAPPPALASEPAMSAAEWAAVERTAEARDDFAQGCPICLEPFAAADHGPNPAVLLSCSHTFHRRCLASAERCIGVAERCCPICRKASYEARITGVAADAARRRAASTLQRGFRKRLAAGRYRARQIAVYGAGRGDGARRRRFQEREVLALGDRVTRDVDARADPRGNRPPVPTKRRTSLSRSDFWTNRLLSSRPRSPAENSGPIRSIVKSG